MAKKKSKDLHKPRIGDERAGIILTTIARYGSIRFNTTTAKNNCLRALSLMTVDPDQDDNGDDAAE